MKTKSSSFFQKGSKTILVVDDDLHILEVLEARLSSAGYRVIKTESAQTALELLQKQTIDMMVSDIKMPEMNGFQLLSQARALCPGLPVVLLTAYGSIPDAVKAVKSGAVEYLTKPFQGKELIEKVDSILCLPQRETASPGRTTLYQGKNQAMKALYEMVQRVAESDVTALILGESGVGKGVLGLQRRRTRAPCFLMRSVISLPRCRCECCAFLRREPSAGWERSRRYPLTAG